jgi:hypothetical protein
MTQVGQSPTQTTGDIYIDRDVEQLAESLLETVDDEGTCNRSPPGRREPAWLSGEWMRRESNPRFIPHPPRGHAENAPAADPRRRSPSRPGSPRQRSPNPGSSHRVCAADDTMAMLRVALADPELLRLRTEADVRQAAARHGG